MRAPHFEITSDDGINYCELWRGRVIEGESEPKTANKDIGQLSHIKVSTRRRLGLEDIFCGLRLKGEIERPRVPYDTEFIQPSS
ncbi:hypothetical protein [Bradyrhizobium cosmicum]|uniref:hypothetical protein n=1 Tax=Bradyrhizobium cosmicum TaxID=1404864 RepID=UPI0028E4B4FC|nr:hypothetical protein [Bradyrhizobium cosmicum]